MATTLRASIMDRVLVLLGDITIANGYLTDVALVTEEIKQYNEFKPKEIPALVPMDIGEEKETVAIPTGSSYGQQGVLSLRVSAVVHDRYNRTRTKRLNLMQDVEKAMLNDATLKALRVWVDPARVVTDDGDIRYFSVWDQYFDITYHYDRSNGG